jgi:hypothetical protein
VNLFANSFQARGQQFDLTPKLPFISRIVAHDRKGQIMVDADPGRLGLQVAFQRSDAIF